MIICILWNNFFFLFFRFSARETAAVQDWLSQELPFHVMRDNPAHVAVILGGMWGARYRHPFPFYCSMTRIAWLYCSISSLDAIWPTMVQANVKIFM